MVILIRIFVCSYSSRCPSTKLWCGPTVYIIRSERHSPESLVTQFHFLSHKPSSSGCSFTQPQPDQLVEWNSTTKDNILPQKSKVFIVSSLNSILSWKTPTRQGRRESQIKPTTRTSAREVWYRGNLFVVHNDKIKGSAGAGHGA